MIKEVIVVEGKSDVLAIGRALEADCLITGGFGLSKRAMNDIKAAYEKRGIIILTDPDGAGERRQSMPMSPGRKRRIRQTEMWASRMPARKLSGRRWRRCTLP